MEYTRSWILIFVLWLCQTLPTTMGYTSGQLRALNAPHIDLTLHSDIQRSVSNLGIKNNKLVHKTHRGCRGGKCNDRVNKPDIFEKCNETGKPMIPTILTATRTVKPHNQVSDPTNLIQVPVNKWNVPSLLNANIRSINNKYDELAILCKDQSVDLIFLTESWCTEDTITTPLSGYACIRHDRNNGQRGGGVMCYVNESIPYKHWTDLDHVDHETLWITLRPYRLPRCYSQLILGIIYHPPKAKNFELSCHISRTLDTLLNRHPNAGIILTGDFNHFQDKYITNQYIIVQIVNKPTRDDKILDKIYTNMCDIFNSVAILPPIATSDHRAVLLQPQPDMKKFYQNRNHQVEQRRSGPNERTYVRS